MEEQSHGYGERVHLVGDPASLALLARLCAKGTVQPEINVLAAELYRHLVHTVVGRELPTRRVEVPTRMIDATPNGVWAGEVIDPQAKAVIVCVARAGIFPSQVCYDTINWLLKPENVRQDHMILARTTDAAGKVTGATIFGAKIGGPIDNAFVFLPDPMGATGSTMATVLDHYRREIEGRPARVLALNLIVTPEYLRRVLALNPSIVIYALRVDRGLSRPEVLREMPGVRWDEECGLNDHGYIVPGGGGFGEVMNNSFV